MVQGLWLAKGSSVSRLPAGAEAGQLARVPEAWVGAEEGRAVEGAEEGLKKAEGEVSAGALGP